MAHVQSTLRARVRDQYAMPAAAHYLRHRRRYSNLLMVAFSAYVFQNVRLRGLPRLISRALTLRLTRRRTRA